MFNHQTNIHENEFYQWEVNKCIIYQFSNPNDVKLVRNVAFRHKERNCQNKISDKYVIISEINVSIFLLLQSAFSTL